MSITYLEFYSGIGGWCYALNEAICRLNEQLMNGNETETNNDVVTISTRHTEKPFEIKRLGAYDHSDLCNDVLHYNFPEIGRFDGEPKLPSFATTGQSRKKRKKSSNRRKSVSIESLSKKQLEEKNATIWMMSPPCQPHTRQHSNQLEDMQDPRSKSFIHLCDMLSKMEEQSLPKIILLENVVGFENVSYFVNGSWILRTVMPSDLEKTHNSNKCPRPTNIVYFRARVVAPGENH